MKINKYIVIVMILFVGCLPIPKGHGSDAIYQFTISKDNLEKRIDSLIKVSNDLERPNFYENDNYYNTNGYFILQYGETDFCFRYLGDSTDWKAQGDSSELFIAFIRSKNDIEDKAMKIKMIENVFVNELGEYIKVE